jgi:hypothetical protein
MSDFQTSLASQIRLAQSRVKPYEGFIFLCGGTADATNPKPASIRDAIYRELAKIDAIEQRIRLAEHYKDWAHDSVYRDLVLFERHLAELSSVIVLVLESPGAIAELGLFSTIDEFRSKLLVYVDAGHYRQQSFIRLGPIDYLEKTHNNDAECHSWIKRIKDKEIFDRDAAEQLQPELAEPITNRLKASKSEEPFDSSRWLHLALLTCDLLNLFSALTVRDVFNCLSKLGLPWLEPDIRQALFLMEKMNLLTMEPSGNQRYFVANDDRLFLKFHIESPTYDLSRFRNDVLDDYKKNDKKRFRAIQNVRKRAST